MLRPFVDVLFWLCEAGWQFALFAAVAGHEYARIYRESAFLLALPLLFADDHGLGGLDVAEDVAVLDTRTRLVENDGVIMLVASFPVVYN